jgi:hypothetical protein
MVAATAWSRRDECAAAACRSRDGGVAETVVLRLAIYLASYRVWCNVGGPCCWRQWHSRADTVSDGDVTAMAECLLAKAGHSWRSRGDGVAETRRRRGGDDGMADATTWRGRCHGVA